MLELTGMVTGSPIGFLAAIGLLRVLTSDQNMDVRLGWKSGHAVMEGIDSETALNALVQHMRDRGKAPEFNWADSPRKVSPDFYRNACEQMKNDQRALGFMAGWASDTVLREGNVAVTRMDMTSGNQLLLKDLRGLAGKLSKNSFHSALFGGPYEPQSSFGLDPIAVRTHAHEHRAPTKSKNPPGKPGLIWLAFESIPLHPVTPVSLNRAQTTGWRNYPNAGYVWPVWNSMLTLCEVQLLRSLPVERLHKRPSVSEVWFSRYRLNAKYGVLLPAQREH